MPHFTLSQLALAGDLRAAVEIAAVEVEQVEQEVHQAPVAPVVPLAERVLQGLEVGHAVSPDDDDLAVQHGFPGWQTGELIAHPCEPLGPVLAAAGQERHAAAAELRKHAVAVELHLVEPPFAGGRPRDQGRELGFDLVREWPSPGALQPHSQMKTTSSP